MTGSAAKIETSVPRGVALAFALALVATLLMAAPVLQAPGQRLFGSGAILGHSDPRRDALIVIEQLRSGRVPSPYMQPLTDIPGRLLAHLVGPVAAYNVLVLATFPLSAAAAYWLGRRVLGSHPGALLAGLAYAFLPFHVTQAAGHPHVAQAQWLPLYWLALWRCVDRPALARAAWLGAAAAAVVLADFYGGFIAAVLSPVALIAHGVVSPRRSETRRARRVMLTGLVLAGAAVGAVVLVRIFAPTVLLDTRSLAFPRTDLFGWSAKWWAYAVPAAEHPLWGAAVREFWLARGVGPSLLEHQQVGLPWALLVLAAVPLGLWLRGERASLAVRSAPVLAVVACTALLCSLSPERRLGAFTFVRPSALLHELAPMFRAYARFGVGVGLATALLAGAGVACLWHGPGTRGRRAGALLLGLWLLESAPFPPWRWRDVLPTRAHRWLAAQPGPLRVLDCAPASRLSDSLAVAWLGHATTLLGAPLFEDCGEPQLAGKLAALGYSHVVLRRDDEGRRLSAREPPDGFARGPAFEDSWILVVRAERPGAYVSAWLGFDRREHKRGATWRWMGRTGALRLVATRASAGTRLALELRSFPGARRVRWSLDGRPRGALELGPAWRRHELPLGPLVAGEHTLGLASEGPAVIARQVLHNADDRALAVALGDWTIDDDGPEGR